MVRRAAAELRLDRQQGRKRRLVIMCEAAGMTPQLARIADPYGIEVLSSGGFSSVTDTHALASEWRRRVVTVLQIGDHDPSGVHVLSHLAEEVAAFAAAYQGDVKFVRLAVTLDQAHELGLESAPPKATDRRAFDGDETYQAEAIDPLDLADRHRGDHRPIRPRCLRWGARRRAQSTPTLDFSSRSLRPPAARGRSRAAIPRVVSRGTELLAIVISRLDAGDGRNAAMSSAVSAAV